MCSLIIFYVFNLFIKLGGGWFKIDSSKYFFKYMFLYLFSRKLLFSSYFRLFFSNIFLFPSISISKPKKCVTHNTTFHLRPCFWTSSKMLSHNMLGGEVDIYIFEFFIYSGTWLPNFIIHMCQVGCGGEYRTPLQSKGVGVGRLRNPTCVFQFLE